jgi:hypothetical protein
MYRRANADMSTTTTRERGYAVTSTRIKEGKLHADQVYVTSRIYEIASEQGKTVDPLREDLILLDSGLDSLSCSADSADLSGAARSISETPKSDPCAASTLERRGGGRSRAVSSVECVAHCQEHAPSESRLICNENECRATASNRNTVHLTIRTAVLMFMGG